MGDASRDELTAYALASFARFDAEVSDELLRAVAGAFALVAAADGDVDAREIERFVALVRERREAFGSLDVARLERGFRDLGEAFLTDATDGRRRALEDIARVKHDAGSRELVLAAARIALLADQRVRASEKDVLHSICRALGVEESRAPRGGLKRG